MPVQKQSVSTIRLLCGGMCLLTLGGACSNSSAKVASRATPDIPGTGAENVNGQSVTGPGNYAYPAFTPVDPVNLPGPARTRREQSLANDGISLLAIGTGRAPAALRRAALRYYWHHEQTWPSTVADLIPGLFIWPAGTTGGEPAICRDPAILAQRAPQTLQSVISTPIEVGVAVTNEGIEFSKPGGQDASSVVWLSQLHEWPVRQAAAEELQNIADLPKAPLSDEFLTLYVSPDLGGISDFNRWDGVRRFGEVGATAEESRYLSAGSDLELLVRDATHIPSEAPTSLQQVLERTASALINLQPATPESQAHIEVAWDGGQGYRFTVTCPGGFVHDTVLWLEKLEADSSRWAHRPASEYIASKGDNFVSWGKFDLVPAGEATLPGYPD